MNKDEWRQAVRKAATDGVGKTIADMEWDDVGDYWVMSFTDGTEMCVRLMAEIDATE